MGWRYTNLEQIEIMAQQWGLLHSGFLTKKSIFWTDFGPKNRFYLSEILNQWFSYMRSVSKCYKSLYNHIYIRFTTLFKLLLNL